jgi:hypothetical protein
LSFVNYLDLCQLQTKTKQTFLRYSTMMIHDIEFFNSCNQEQQQSDAAIVGGSSYEGYTDISVSGNNITATAEVKTTGNYTNSAANTSTAISVQPGYSGGYGSGYSAGYGLDTYGSVSAGVSQGVGTL